MRGGGFQLPREKIRIVVVDPIRAFVDHETTSLLKRLTTRGETMAQPPRTPPQSPKGKDEKASGAHRDHSAEQEEIARKHSAGRPEGAKR
jgi:hypothetical protein